MLNSEDGPAPFRFKISQTARHTHTAAAGGCMASGVEPVGKKDEPAIQPVVGKPNREAAVPVTG